MKYFLKMNRETKFRIRKANLDLLEWNETSHINCIRLNPANTLEHEFKKVELCWDMLKNNQEFITEARFKCGVRADIFEINAGIVWEVMHTEKEKSIQEKIEKLPKHIQLIKIKTEVN